MHKHNTIIIIQEGPWGYREDSLARLSHHHRPPIPIPTGCCMSHSFPTPCCCRIDCSMINCHGGAGVVNVVLVVAVGRVAVVGAVNVGSAVVWELVAACWSVRRYFVVWAWLEGVPTATITIVSPKTSGVKTPNNNNKAAKNPSPHDTVSETAAAENNPPQESTAPSEAQPSDDKESEERGGTFPSPKRPNPLSPNNKKKKKCQPARSTWRISAWRTGTGTTTSMRRPRWRNHSDPTNESGRW